MKKISRSKLALNRETLQALDATALDHVNGGQAGLTTTTTTTSIPPSIPRCLSRLVPTVCPKR